MKSWIASVVVVAAALLSGCRDATDPHDVNCSRGTLAPGATVTGTLAQGACTTSDEFAPTYVDYTVTVSSGERYLFTLQSETAWRPVLELHNDADPAAGPRTGWSDDTSKVGAHSEILFVSPYNGTLTLRVLAVQGPGGAYSLRSQQCGGNSLPIQGGGTVSAEGTIDAADCVVHDRLMDNDSAHADTYVVYLGRNEVKAVKVKERFLGDGFAPAIVLAGPFISGSPTSVRQYSMTSLDSLVVQITGGNDAGNYILAVAGATPGTVGAYVLTVGPATP